MPSPEQGSTTEPQPTDPTPTLLSQSFTDWLAQPWTHHVVALTLLALLALVRFWPLLTAPEPHIDEALYERAFGAVQEGRSPYVVRGYYYPTAFAYLGNWLTETIGPTATRNSLRTLNVLALSASLWLSIAWWSPSARSTTRSRRALRNPWLERWAIAALLLVAAPGIWQGIFLGNLSFIAIGLALGSLAFADRRPIPAAVALAVSVAFKPIAAATLPVLVLTPPLARQRAYRLAGLVGGALTAILWLAFPYFFELLGQHVERIGRIRTWSLYRLLDVLGLDLGRLVILTCVVIVALVAGWQARRAKEEWLAVVLTASLLATPLIWGHTLILFLPVMMMAASVARDRFRTRGARRIAWAEPVFVALGWAVMLYTNAGAIDDLPWLAEVLLLLEPIATLVLMTAYICRYGKILLPNETQHSS